MARRIDYSARYHFGADEVYAALSSRSYWEDVVEEMNKYSPNYIDSFHVDRSGVDITFHHVIPRDMLPDLARAILRKDMVITGGENVYPAEVETVLITHPEVEEVAVVGLPDPEYGEIVTAVIVRSPDSELDAGAVLAFARDRLVRYKAPRRVEFVDALPRDPMGKVRKRRIREALA